MPITDSRACRSPVLRAATRRGGSISTWPCGRFYRAGEKAFVDYAGPKFEVVDRKTRRGARRHGLRRCPRREPHLRGRDPQPRPAVDGDHHSRHARHPAEGRYDTPLRCGRGRAWQPDSGHVGASCHSRGLDGPPRHPGFPDPVSSTVCHYPFVRPAAHISRQRTHPTPLLRTPARSLGSTSACPPPITTDEAAPRIERHRSTGPGHDHTMRTAPPTVGIGEFSAECDVPGIGVASYEQTYRSIRAFSRLGSQISHGHGRSRRHRVHRLVRVGDHNG